MSMRDNLIGKIKILPENILREVSDYVDFLEFKKKKDQDNWEWLAKNEDRIEETDFSDYLVNLTNYEEMLAEGKIAWK